jgi:hypothetical protein
LGFPIGALSVDPAGDALFGWTRVPHEGTTATRKAQIRERSATGTLGPIIDASDISTDWDLVNVGLSDGGTGLVSMINDDGSGIAVRTITQSGALGATESVATANSGEQITGASMHVFPDGEALFTWLRVTSADTEPFRILQARFRRADGTWGAVRTISNPTIGDATAARIAGDSIGNALLVWDNLHDRIRARRISISTLGPLVNITPSSVLAHLLGAQLADDGSAVIAWYRPAALGEQDEVEWLNPDNTHTPAVSPGPQANGTLVTLDGADSAWLMFQVPGHADEIRSFAQSGTLGTRENVPEPSGAPVDNFGSAVAGGPGGELVVETGYDTFDPVLGHDVELAAVAIHTGT